MTIKAIHDIAIIAGNYELSKRFYTELLGFTIIREVYRAERDSYKLDLAVNGLYQIELFSFRDCKPRASFPEANGLRHLAFAVDNVAEWIDYLRANNVDTQDIRIDETKGKQFTFFNDPDGQPLELYEVF